MIFSFIIFVLIVVVICSVDFSTLSLDESTERLLYDFTEDLKEEAPSEDAVKTEEIIENDVKVKENTEDDSAGHSSKVKDTPGKKTFQRREPTVHQFEPDKNTANKKMPKKRSASKVDTKSTEASKPLTGTSKISNESINELQNVLCGMDSGFEDEFFDLEDPDDTLEQIYRKGKK